MAYVRRRFDGAVLGRDFLPRPGPRQPVDDDAIGGRKSGANDTQAVYDRTELDALGADRAVFGDRENDLARLIGRNRAVGNQQRVMGAAEQPQPPEEARGEKAILVVEDGAGSDGAGLGIDRVIDEIHSPHDA